GEVRDGPGLAQPRVQRQRVGEHLVGERVGVHGGHPGRGGRGHGGHGHGGRGHGGHGTSYRSSTSRSSQERDTHGNMQSFAARSWSARIASRWSGRPESTVVSQVPQIPCRQDDSTSTPAARTASSTEASGGTSTTTPARANSTVNGPGRAGAARSAATNRSRCSVYGGHPAQARCAAASNGAGPQQYTFTPSRRPPTNAARSSRPCSSCGTSCTRSG